MRTIYHKLKYNVLKCKKSVASIYHRGLVDSIRDWEGKLEMAADRIAAKSTPQEPLGSLWQLIYTHGPIDGAEPETVEKFVWQKQKKFLESLSVSSSASSSAINTVISSAHWHELVDAAVANALPNLSLLIANDYQVDLDISPSNETITRVLDRYLKNFADEQHELLLHKERLLAEEQELADDDDDNNNRNNNAPGQDQDQWMVGDEEERETRLASQRIQKVHKFTKRRLQRTVEFIVDHTEPERLGPLFMRWVGKTVEKYSRGELFPQTEFLAEMATLRREQDNYPQEVKQLEADASVKLDEMYIYHAADIRRQWQARLPLFTDIFAAGLRMKNGGPPTIPGTDSRRFRKESFEYLQKLQRIYIDPALNELQQLDRRLLEIRSIKLSRRNFLIER